MSTFLFEKIMINVLAQSEYIIKLKSLLNSFLLKFGISQNKNRYDVNDPSFQRGLMILKDPSSFQN